MCCGHSAIAASAEPCLGFEVITRAYIVQTPIALLVSARRCGGSKESRIAADGTRLQATRVMGLLRRRGKYSGGHQTRWKRPRERSAWPGLTDGVEKGLNETRIVSVFSLGR